MLRPPITPASLVSTWRDATNALLLTVGTRAVVDSWENALTVNLSDYDDISTQSFYKNWENTTEGGEGRALYHKTGNFNAGSAGTGDAITWFDAVGNEFTLSSVKPQATMFGGVGDDVTDDTAAFVLIEGSSFDRIYLEVGKIYVVNGISLTKEYYGPGQIKLDGVIQEFGPDKLVNRNTNTVVAQATDDGVSVNGRVTDVEDPVNDQDVVNKRSVEGLFGTTVMPFYIAGFSSEYDSGNANRFKVHPGVCASQLTFGSTAKMTLSTTLTKDISSSWSEGNNGGALPSNLTIVANGTYRVFAIAKDDGTTDIGIDTSPTAASLLSDASGDGYTQYRRIGWLFTDASSQVVPYAQNGEEFKYLIPQATITTTSTGLSSIAIDNLPYSNFEDYDPPIVHMDVAVFSRNARLYLGPGRSGPASATLGYGVGELHPTIEGIDSDQGGDEMTQATVRIHTDHDGYIHAISAGTYDIHFSVRGWTDKRGAQGFESYGTETFG